MLSSKTKLFRVKVDEGKLLKKIDREMSIILREAVRVWLRTVLKVVRRAPHTVGDNFPIQTGAAKASLRPLARSVRVAIPIRPAKKRPNLTAEGEASSSFEIRDDRTHPLSFKYRFNWNTDLEHFLLNEFNSMGYKKGSRTPWNAIQKADIAATKYIQQAVRKRLKTVKLINFAGFQRGGG